MAAMLDKTGKKMTNHDGAYVCCIILVFITAFHHLHVTLVCQQVLLCALI